MISKKFNEETMRDKICIAMEKYIKRIEEYIKY